MSNNEGTINPDQNPDQNPDHNLDDKRQRRLAELFDIRTVIGALFAIYGLVCLITGITDFSSQDAARAGGVNINLWSGIGMLVVAAIFIVWSLTKPFHPPESHD